MPLGDASIAFWIVPSLRFPGWQWILLALAAPILTWAAWPFYKAAIRNGRHRDRHHGHPGLHGHRGRHGVVDLCHVLPRHEPRRSIVSLRAGSPTEWGDLSRCGSRRDHLPLAGRYFEAVSKRRSGKRCVLSLRSAPRMSRSSTPQEPNGAARSPHCARAIGSSSDPGETVATDGEVIFGQSAIDRSAMTGESIPADVTVGDAVVGGTVCVGGRLVVRATKLGADTQLAQMLRLVEDAQNQKANVQRTGGPHRRRLCPGRDRHRTPHTGGWLLAGGTNEQAFSARFPS